MALTIVGWRASGEKMMQHRRQGRVVDLQISMRPVVNNFWEVVCGGLRLSVTAAWHFHRQRLYFFVVQVDTNSMEVTCHLLADCTILGAR